MSSRDSQIDVVAIAFVIFVAGVLVAVLLSMGLK